MWFDLAAAQAGAISRSQLLDAGLSASSMDRRLRSGTLRRLHPGVYAIAGSPDTVARRRWAALLAVGLGAVLSFDSAARVHRLTAAAADGPVVLTVPHSGSQSLAGVVVHQIDDLLSPADVVEVDGFPVTSVPRTIVDLAATWRRGRLGLLIDDAVTAKRTTDADIGACLRSVARRGKPGVRMLTSILDERGPGKVPPASVLERDFFRLLAPSPLPEPQRQYPLPRTDGVRGLVDSAWPEVKLIAEVDGRRWHQRIADMKRDRDRDLHAAALGWQVVRPLHEHVVGAPDETRRELVAVYDVRRRQLGGAA